MRFLRILGVLIGIAFVLLLVFGFDSLLGLLRSRVAIFLAFLPLLLLFGWSIYKLLPTRRSRRDYIDITPPKS
jgi:hypothetical protein